MSMENFAPLMFGGLVVFLLIGYPVAFSLAAVGLFFGFIGIELGFFEVALLQAFAAYRRGDAKEARRAIDRPGAAELLDASNRAIQNDLSQHPASFWLQEGQELWQKKFYLTREAL